MTRLTLTIAASAALMLSILLAVVFAKRVHISWLVTIVARIQRMAIIGSVVGPHLSNDGGLHFLKDTLEVITMFNIDIRVLKPGCHVRVMSYLTVVAATFVFVVATFVAFALAAACWTWRIHRRGLAKLAMQHERDEILRACAAAWPVLVNFEKAAGLRLQDQRPSHARLDDYYSGVLLEHPNPRRNRLLGFAQSATQVYGQHVYHIEEQGLSVFQLLRIRSWFVFILLARVFHMRITIMCLRGKKRSQFVS
jgi:hypothetical protein